MTAPTLMPIKDFGGDWSAYSDALYRVFERDIVRHDLRFRGLPVSAKRNPEYDGKRFAFWHMISEGNIEEDRTPNLRRCERLPQVRWIVENADSRTEIDVWEQRRKTERNWALWYEEYYLIILGQRSDHFLLKTAFCTEHGHGVRKYRKERDRYCSSQT